MLTIAIGRATLTITNPGAFSGNLVVRGTTQTPSEPTINTAGATLSYALASGENDVPWSVVPPERCGPVWWK